MAFGTLFTRENNCRSTAIRAVAKANDIELNIVEAEKGNATVEHLKANGLGKIPAFIGEDGFALSESIAIAIYITSQNEKTTLLGKTKQDYASILKWMSFANAEILPPLAGAFRPILGKAPYNKKAVEESLKTAFKNAKVIEEHLTHNTYLVGERLSLADIFTASLISRGFEYFFEKKWRSENPATTRWFETVWNQPIWQAIAEPFKFIDEAVKNQPPKQEAKPKAEKPKAAPKTETEDEPAPAPKAKHPIEELGRPTFAIDDWKRKYSNEETREVALPWFWENVNFEEYSIWSVDYKYNDELTMTFMTSNLIGGFFARLEASRKYLFGAASVYGVTNDSVIKGAFLVRGQEALPAFDVAPDYESYEFKKLDPKNPEDKKFVEDQWSWDKPIEVNGKTYEWADGKVFK